MASYDGNLQMFVQTPRRADETRLSFLRWLAEQGRLERRIRVLEEEYLLLIWDWTLQKMTREKKKQAE